MKSALRYVTLCLSAAACLTLPAAAQTARPFVISTTSNITSPNPYSQSDALHYGLWCQVYGCLGRFNYAVGQYEGMLVEGWSVVNETTWRFVLKSGLKRHDGGAALTAADVVHSYNRVLTDPKSAQAAVVVGIESIEQVDDRTFDVHTKQPFAPLLSYIFDRFIITSKELFDKHGAGADEAAPFGWGPYKLVSYTVDQQITVERNHDWASANAKAPELVTYSLVREADQRINTLLSGDVDVATLVPPQLTGRVTADAGLALNSVGSQEPMFIALSPKTKPWDNLKVRQAVRYAINRQGIVDKLLRGEAELIDGFIGPNQYCYDPSAGHYGYDPDKARALLKESGLVESGPLKVEMFTSNGRYIQDLTVMQAITDMLNQVGFQVELQAPEWANFWADVRAGKVPAYYMGRGGIQDPSDAISQYLETGVTPRVGYSSPELDKMLAEERHEFDPKARCALLNKINAFIVEESPIVSLWTHKLLYATRAGVTYPMSPTGEAWLLNVVVD